MRTSDRILYTENQFRLTEWGLWFFFFFLIKSWLCCVLEWASVVYNPNTISFCTAINKIRKIAYIHAIWKWAIIFGIIVELVRMMIIMVLLFLSYIAYIPYWTNENFAKFWIWIEPQNAAEIFKVVLYTTISSHIHKQYVSTYILIK